MDPPSSSAPIRQITRKPINSPNLHDAAPQSTPQPPPANHSPVLDQSDRDPEVEKPLPAFLPADLDSKKASPAPSVETGSITPITYAPYSTSKPTLRQRFDKLLPPGKTYWKRFTRRAFLLILLGIMLLAVLIIALALGLGLKSRRGVANLPLPGDAAVHKGDLTYYDVGLGACGIEHSNSDAVCAVSHLVYDAMSTSSNPNENPLCGKKIRIRRKDERDGHWKSVDVEVVDRCEGCKAEDIDLSPEIFKDLADPALGRVDGEWAWL